MDARRGVDSVAVERRELVIDDAKVHSPLTCTPEINRTFSIGSHSQLESRVA